MPQQLGIIRLIIIGVVVILLLGATGFGVTYALSQPGQTSTTSATVATIPATNPSSTSIGTGQGNKQTSFLGVIQSLNNQSIVITTLRGNRTVNVTVSDSTKYTALEGPASFSDLKVGQAVNVGGQLNTQNQTLTALRVILLPPLGRLTGINGQTLTLMTVDSKIVQVHMSSTTIVYVPFGLRSVAVSARAIQVGQILGYEGTTASDGSVSAARLWLLGLPAVRGIVTSVNGNVLTLQAANGSSVTVNLSPNTTYVQGGQSLNQGTPVASNAQALQVGDTVAVIADGKLASGTATAILVVVVQ